MGLGYVHQSRVYLQARLLVNQEIPSLFFCMVCCLRGTLPLIQSRVGR